MPLPLPTANARTAHTANTHTRTAHPPTHTHTTASLWPATKENVRQHLHSLGYQDVPESVLQEFVDDLNQLEREQKTIGSLLAQSERQQEVQDSFHRHLSPKKASGGGISGVTGISGIAARTASGITREQILRQLEDMGYGANVPEAVLEELVQELNDAYEKEHPSAATNKIPSYQRPLKKSATPGAPTAATAAATTTTSATTTTGAYGGGKNGTELPPPLSSSSSLFGRSYGGAPAAFTKAKKDLDPLLQQLADLELSGVRAKVQQQQQLKQQHHPHHVTIHDDIHGYLLHGKHGAAAAAAMMDDDSSYYLVGPHPHQEGQLRRSQSAPGRFPSG